MPTASQLATWTVAQLGDPQFVNAGGGDFHLRATSPAVGAGEVNSVYATVPAAVRHQHRDRYRRHSPAANLRASAPTTRRAPPPQHRQPLRSRLTGSIAGPAIALQWVAPAVRGCSAAPSYVLEIGSASGLSNLANTPVGASTTLSIPATGVPAGSYYFRVRAQNTAGTSHGVQRARPHLRRKPAGRARDADDCRDGIPDDAGVERPRHRRPVTSYVLEVGSASGSE